MLHDGNIVDRVIDEIAREMTSAPPPTDTIEFRAVVIGRLEETTRSSRWIWMAAPVVVAILLAIAVLLNRQTARVDLTPDVATAEHAVTAPPGTLAPSRHPGTLAPSRHLGTLAPWHLGTLAPSTVAALAPPPITVDSIALMEIERASSIELPQLETIAPLALQPIGEPQEPQGERQ